jgi:hypothetical protein
VGIGCFIFPVSVTITGHDLTGGTVEREVHLAFEYRALLHQVIGKNMETALLRKNRGLIL